jgi:hypothetical protein
MFIAIGFIVVLSSLAYAATVSHSASQVMAGTFGIGDFSFNGSLGILNSSAFSVFYVNASSGNVGIGTTNPKYLLEVTSGAANIAGELSAVATITGAQTLASAGILSLESNNAMAANTGSILTFKARYLTADSTSAMFAAIKGLKENSVSGNLNGTMTFHVRRDGQDANTASERMRITSAGNVGIGTTTPGQKLTVAGDTNIIGNLIVGGNLSGGSPLKVIGGINVIGDANMTGNITFNGGGLGGIIFLGKSDVTDPYTTSGSWSDSSFVANNVYIPGKVHIQDMVELQAQGGYICYARLLVGDTEVRQYSKSGGGYTWQNTTKNEWDEVFNFAPGFYTVKWQYRVNSGGAAAYIRGRRVKITSVSQYYGL